MFARGGVLFPKMHGIRVEHWILVGVREGIRETVQRFCGHVVVYCNWVCRARHSSFPQEEDTLAFDPRPRPPGLPGPPFDGFQADSIPPLLLLLNTLHLFRPAVFSSAFSETPGLHNLRGPDLISRRCPAHGPDLPQVSPSRRGCCGRKRRKFVYVKHFEQSTQSNDTKRMCYVFIWVVHSTHVSDFSAEKGQILFSSQINNQ